MREFDTDLADGRVRVAVEDDADAVERLWNEYAAVLASYDDRYLIQEGGRDRWRDYFTNSLVNSSRGDVLLAERDGDVMGVVEVRVGGGHPVFKFGQHGQLYGHFVDPEFRRKGIGTALVGAAETWFRERDLPFYRYHVLHGVAEAALYEDLGMEPMEVVYETEL
ncbi:N-acetyltransferase [Halobacteriales archaeon QS_8_69_26]|nr:MAG: N-acetyltransferase [Halobacteriales archaeon QS_8_69_26]